MLPDNSHDILKYYTIQEARVAEYQRIVTYDSTTIFIVHKNGFGKTTIQCRYFKENDEVAFISFSHEHIENVIIRKLESEFHMQEGVDFVYVRPFELLCESYFALRERKDTEARQKIKTIQQMRAIGLSARVIHDEVLKCNNPNCGYRNEEWNISKRNPDRITRIVCTYKMYVNKEIEYLSRHLIIDEIDSLMYPERVELESEIIKQIEPFIGEDLIRLSDTPPGYLEITGRIIKKRKEIISEFDAHQDAWKEAILSGWFPDDNERREIKLWNHLQRIAIDGYIPTERSGRYHADWHYGYGDKQYILESPILHRILNSLASNSGALKKDAKIILSMARARKNPILQRRFRQVVQTILSVEYAVNWGGIHTSKYKELNARRLLPAFIGEDIDFPDEPWAISVTKPTSKMNITHIKNVYSKENEFGKAPVEFLKLNEQINPITTMHHNQHGLLITFGNVVRWVHSMEKRLKDANYDLYGELLKFNSEKTADAVLNALKSKKWTTYLRRLSFGNGSAGMDMEPNERFLIVVGNWWNGEMNEFNGFFYPRSNNNNRLTVSSELSRKLKYELQSLMMRDYMEYPLRSRRKLPVYCITNYFYEDDPDLININREILADYNVTIMQM